jgi:hypothetical protein
MESSVRSDKIFVKDQDRPYFLKAYEKTQYVFSFNINTNNTATKEQNKKFDYFYFQFKNYSKHKAISN